MGIPGLWEILRPASETRSLTHLAVKDGFEKNPYGVRGYRIGIDASIWHFHMEYGREGENPELRTLFFRCAKLMASPFLPLFVFDGPKRPDFKRGKKVNKAAHKLIPSMKEIIEAFGFEHRTAPGEAEAELAYLNEIGVIDGILSDDVDNFVFGAQTVIRNASNNLSGNRANPVLNSAGKDDKNHTRVYHLPAITAHPEIQLTRGGIILIALLSGGDYHAGLRNCGMKTAVGLAKCGFGDTLYHAALEAQSPEELKPFLDTWRETLRKEIATDPQKKIGRKSPTLARNLENTWPPVEVLMSYVNPVTSRSMRRPYKPGDITWDREPNISSLAAICERFFEWGYKESIVKRFRTVIWHSAVLRILRRATLDLDKRIPPAIGPATPSRTGRGALTEPPTCGTPSRMIAKHFAGLEIDDTADRLILKIHSTRTHPYTDGLLEYRLEVAPAQLVFLAELGVQGTRQKPVDEWASEPEDNDDMGVGKEEAGKDPMEHMRVWMPACMVRDVEPGLVKEFEENEARKAAKKAGKGTGRGKKKKTAEEDGEVQDGVSPPKTKPKAKPRAKKAAASQAITDDDDEEGDLPTFPASPSKGKTAKRGANSTKTTTASTSTSGTSKPKPKAKSTSEARRPRMRASSLSSSSSDDDDDNLGISSPSKLFGVPLLRRPATTTSSTGKGKARAMPAYVDVDDDVPEIEDEEDEPVEGPPPTPEYPPDDPVIGPSPSPRRREGVRDLTKKKNPVASGSSARIFPSSGMVRAASVFSVVSSPERSPLRNEIGGSSKERAPKPAPAPVPFLRFFDDPPPGQARSDDTFDSDDLFSHTPREKGKERAVAESDDDESFFSSPSKLLLSKPKVPEKSKLSSTTTINLASPSKSRTYTNRHSPEVLSIAGSESDAETGSRERYKKSPRKSKGHASPALSRTASSSSSKTASLFTTSAVPSSSTSRVPSPSPAPALRAPANLSAIGLSKKPLSKTGVSGPPPSKARVALPVYEISSDSDDDDNAMLLSSTQSQRRSQTGSQRVGKKSTSASGVGRNVIDVIDLT